MAPASVRSSPARLGRRMLSLRESATAGGCDPRSFPQRRPGANVAGGAGPFFGALVVHDPYADAVARSPFDPAATSAADRRKSLPARGRTRRTPGRTTPSIRVPGGGQRGGGRGGAAARSSSVDRSSAHRDRRRCRAAVASHGPSHATDSDQSRATRRDRGRGRRAGERRAWSPPSAIGATDSPRGRSMRRALGQGSRRGGAGAPCRLGVSNPRERDPPRRRWHHAACRNGRSCRRRRRRRAAAAPRWPRQAATVRGGAPSRRLRLGRGGDRDRGLDRATASVRKRERGRELGEALREPGRRNRPDRRLADRDDDRDERTGRAGGAENPASAVAAARQPPAGDAAAGSGEAAIAIGRCVVAAALARAVSLAGTSGAPLSFAVEPAATESGTATDAGASATSRPAASRSFASVSSRRARRAAQIAMRRATPAPTSTSRGASPASSSTKRARLRTSRATCLVRSQASAKPLAARCASDAAAASWPPFSASSIT